MNRNNELSKNADHNESLQLTEKGRKFLHALGATAGATLLVLGARTIDNGPTFEGHQIVNIHDGDRVDDLINDRVNGGKSHTGEVREEVYSDPRNDETLKDGIIQPGEPLVLPKSVR